MGYQMQIHEASDTIMSAMRLAGENLNTDFSHVYSKPGNQGFYVEIADLNIKRKTGSGISADWSFSLNIPYDYFNDAELNIDNRLGINLSDAVDVKAEIRCMDLITKTYEKWLPDHDVFTIKELIDIIRQAQIKLEKIKHISFSVAGNKKEIAEKYAEFWFTESHIPQGQGSFTDRFFPVNFSLQDYFAPVGSHWVDLIVGKQVLEKKNKYDVCLLRVAYVLYHEFVGFIHNKWPTVYFDFKDGKF